MEHRLNVPTATSFRNFLDSSFTRTECLNRATSEQLIDSCNWSKSLNTHFESNTWSSSTDWPKRVGGIEDLGCIEWAKAYLGSLDGVGLWLLSPWIFLYWEASLHLGLSRRSPRLLVRICTIREGLQLRGNNLCSSPDNVSCFMFSFFLSMLESGIIYNGTRGIFKTGYICLTIHFSEEYCVIILFL